MTQKKTGLSPRAGLIFRDSLLCITGITMYAVGITAFAAPHDIAPGGASGLAILVNYLTGIPIGLFVLIFNIPLLLFAFRSEILPRGFIWRSTWVIILLSAATDLFKISALEYHGDPLLASMIAGALMGGGMGLAHLGGANTGGISLLGLLLQLRRPHLKTGQLLSLLNSVVIVASGLVYGNIENLLYAIVTVYISGLFMDRIIDTGGAGSLMIVMSDCTDRVRELFLQQQKSITVIRGEGGYSGNTQRVILCAVSRTDGSRLKKLIRKTDPAALVIVNDSNTLEGKGFSHVI
jgi:uncharacterized membrane-anchored protein YitT (DUF2179 family)